MALLVVRPAAAQQGAARPAATQEAPPRDSARPAPAHTPAADRPGSARLQPAPPGRTEPGLSGLVSTSDLPWAGALAGTLVLAATGPGLDEDVARETDRDPDGLDGAVADAGDVAGSLWLDYGGAAGAFGVARLADRDGAARMALRVLVSLAATDAVTAGLKVATGRARPDTDPLDADRFDAFSLDEDHRSLPSGHAARLFAVATTLHRELGDEAPWVPWAAYPAATAGAAGRVADREHWVTDVLAGAAVGTLVPRIAGRLGLVGGGDDAAVRLRAGTTAIGTTLGLSVPLR